MFNSKTPERIANDGNFDTPDINNLKRKKDIEKGSCKSVKGREKKKEETL